MPSVSLRTYQSDALRAVRADWARGVKRVIVAMPTGTGKTWLFVFLIWAARKNGHRSLILVTTDEQVNQTVEKLVRVGIAPGIVKRERNEWTRRVVVASVQTLHKDVRLMSVPPDWFGVIITDECHLANAPSHQKIINRFSNSWHLGLTATPFRGDRQSLAEAGWESVSYVYSIDQAISDGWLVPLQIVKVETNVSLDDVATMRDPLTGVVDFRARRLAERVDTPERNEMIVRSYRDAMEGVRSIAFCVSVRHAWRLANTFRRFGVEAYVLTGETHWRDRRRLLEAHRKGRFKVLTNCNVLTQGYDDESLEGIIMARPTKSKVLYMQSVGRGLRPYRGKTSCKLLDVVDVSREHQMAINAELLGLRDDLGQRVELGQGSDASYNSQPQEGS